MNCCLFQYFSLILNLESMKYSRKNQNKKRMMKHIIKNFSSSRREMAWDVCMVCMSFCLFGDIYSTHSIHFTSSLSLWADESTARFAKLTHFSKDINFERTLKMLTMTELGKFSWIIKQFHNMACISHLRWDET